MPQKLIKTENLTQAEAILKLLADDFPALRAEIERCHARIKRRFYYRGITADQRDVLRAVRQGYATAREISEFLNIPYVTVTKRLRELVEGDVLTTTRPPHAEGRGGDRSTKLYWLTGRWREIFKALQREQAGGQAELFDQPAAHGKRG